MSDDERDLEPRNPEAWRDEYRPKVPFSPPSGMYGVLSGLRTYAGKVARHLGFLRPEDPLSDQIANLHEEVSELWRAHRRGELDKPCDKAQAMRALGYAPLTCAEEECADVLQRLLEVAEVLGVDLERAYYAKSSFAQTRPHRDAPGGRCA